MKTIKAFLKEDTGGGLQKLNKNDVKIKYFIYDETYQQFLSTDLINFLDEEEYGNHALESFTVSGYYLNVEDIFSTSQYDKDFRNINLSQKNAQILLHRLQEFQNNSKDSTSKAVINNFLKRKFVIVEVKTESKRTAKVIGS